MSNKELSRLEVMERIASGRLTQVEASRMLKLSKRQVIRLVKAHKTYGAAGLISKRRGKPSNNQLDPALKAQSIFLIKEHYYDFDPTLAKEINKIVSQAKKKPYKPASTHPWKKGLLTMGQKQNYQHT